MNKKILNVLVILDAILLVSVLPVIFLLIYAGITGGGIDFFGYVQFAADAVIAMLALYYMLTGCKKGKGTNYYRWFMISFGLLMLLSLYKHKAMSIHGVMFTALAFATLAVLCFGKDLGRKLSTTLSILVTGCTVCHLVSDVAFGKELPGYILFDMAVRILLALTTVLMVCAKYQDKAERGSK